ncbi:hydrogenase [Mycobacterium sp. M1]|uniref:Hydrogenase n=1 Tax=Mycolicibacter acidiphilus TaxID=2835306 RepID=A0ABS5RJY2_9MYCO|nr:hydrogenase [Mycolicibacter acidiphilus]MBS9534595.1 hydrogenase [Mycolicibacter acidiphilus]
MDKLLIQLGVLLILLGLLTGLAIPKLKNPRMGLSSHLEGVLNGMLLMIVGLIWPRLTLSHAWLSVGFCLVVYAAFANWMATLLGAAWGARTLMPIAAGDHGTSSGREGVIGFLLVSLALSIIAASVLILVGLC